MRVLKSFNNITDLKSLTLKYYLVIFLLTSFVSTLINAQLPSNFQEETIGGSWNAPVQIIFDEIGRGYVVEREGRVWILDEEGNKLPNPLIDLDEEIVVFGDHGLLSMVFHPNFRSNGYFYLLYTVDRHHLLYYGTSEYNSGATIKDQATIGRITRYTADPKKDFTSIITGSRKVLIGDKPNNGFPILMLSHGIGSLAFGTDGTLLASCGDSGSFISPDAGNDNNTYFSQALEDGIIRPKENIGSFRSQLVDCLNGKIIRIDAETGRGIPSNPFYNQADPNSAASKVWVLGFRQPYRFVVKPGSGSHFPEDANPGILIVGDVGWGDWEELNVVDKPGMNFGWPLYEGFHRRWGYYELEVLNPDATNPLYGTGNCEQQYFTFKDVFTQPILDGIPSFSNPCDFESEIGEMTQTFVHALPAIAWSNQKYNPPTRTFINVWDELGQVNPVEIQDSLSTLNIPSFDGSSSIAGFFYEGQAFPEKYKGKYFHADLAGWIKTFDFDEDMNLIHVDDFHTDIEFIIDMELHPLSGELYHVNVFHKVFKVSYGANVAPNPVVQTDKLYGPSPLTVQFDASQSTDSNADSMNYHWDFGNGSSSMDKITESVFTSENNDPKSFKVKLTVTDEHGASKSTEETISVNNTPPIVNITSVQNGDFYSTSGTTYLKLEADVFDLEHDPEELTYNWQVFLHHNNHFHAETPDQSVVSQAVIAPAGCRGEEYFYRISLEVTDGHDLTGKQEVNIYPYCGEDIIRFIEVDAIAKEDKVSVLWRADEMRNIQNFVIERAPQYGAFERIGIVTSDIYEFDDIEPFQGDISYRIRAVDGKGIYKFSDVATVSYPLPPPFAIYPNPFTENFTIKMESTNDSKIKFEVFSPEGIKVFGRTWSHSQKQLIFERQIRLPNLSTGIYYFRLADGDTNYHGTLMKG